MKNGVKKARKSFGLGFLAAGAAIGTGATLYALYKRQQREQIYHEAEIKAMDELDDLMAENESACAACSCLDDCAAQGGDCCADGQIAISEEPAADHDAAVPGEDDAFDEPEEEADEDALDASPGQV